ncbi:hypothetical protein OTK49_02275 [Vibrio coralliirubri]|uniref:hypothetical protein n=1 Tax=Vibrio coralliirubri TaxID=1516159 RepID=UPI002284E8EA|nr:hypothetical protein [Vibrio coralliirubri]MCY9861342.1 hypothetical protein [Vibrio coralliirubri]
MKINVTDAQLMSACFSYDHSFGLQSPSLRSKMMKDARRWWEIVASAGVNLDQTEQCMDQIIASMSEVHMDVFEAKSWILAIIKEITEPSYFSKEPHRISEFLIGTDENNYGDQIASLFKG